MKILYVTYYYLPSTCSNAKRPYLLANSLAYKGHFVEVVSSYSLLPEQYKEINTDNTVIVNRINEPVKQFRVLSNKHFMKYVYKIFKKFLWPDTAVIWPIRVYCNYIKKMNNYDLVIIETTPISTLLLLISKVFLSKSILDYQEFYSKDTPVRGFQPLYKLLSPILHKLQKYALSNSKCNIFSADSYLSNYICNGILANTDKSYCIPFFYDDTIRESVVSSVKSKFSVCYAGQFASGISGRSPETFFKSLRKAISLNNKIQEDLEFNFFGTWFSEDDVYIEENELWSIVRINKPVPFGRYIKILQESSILLLITAQEDNIFVPSKLLDYLATRKPILGFIPKDSEAYKILKRTHMDEFTVDEFDVTAGAFKILELWEKWKIGDLSLKSVGSDFYSSKNLIPQFIEILEKHANI